LDAVELLIGQHRALEAKMKALKESQDERRRGDLLAQAGDDLTVHLASEEEIFYPAVRARRTEDILLESLEEHLSLKRLLADLIALPLSAPTFAAKFQVLKEQTEHHHKEEEEHLFPKVMLLLDADARADLGREMEALQLRLQRGGAPRAAVVDQTDAAAPLQPSDAGPPGR
jgi:hemerythrin superfamily protein